MVERVSIDTTFLIDHQRERATGREGPATRFLRDHSATRLLLSPVALAEFAEGFADIEHPLVELTRRSHELLVIDDQVSDRYATIAQHLRTSGELIGANDLWIAATALRYQVPVVTANAVHFARVPNLTVVRYRPA
jgi:predicted nucleic acid-binding protein